MTHIHLLSTDVVEKIAAGEAVERPVSVVKELVENALDAGARRITIEYREGGLQYISVQDDGSGVPAADAALVFARHATSKISSLEDLWNAATLGFRGEALASIAAVAEVEFLTHGREEATAVSLRAGEGAVDGPHPAAAPAGTRVTVRNLFAHVPARRKFLASPKGEGLRIVETVRRLALGNPGVQFVLLSDGREVLRTSGSGKLCETIGELYGPETAAGMLEVVPEEPTDGEIHVSGMVGQPTLNYADRRHISIYVNGRWIQDRRLPYAITEAYRSLIAESRYPIAIIAVNLPPEQVDVNVHPTKAEVRFLHEREVYGAVQRAVRQTLLAGTAIPQWQDWAPPPPAEEPAAGPDWAAGEDWRSPRPLPTPGKLVTSTPTSLQVPLPTRKIPPLRVLGQVANTFIIAEGPDGMYLIDQHTAHERVTYERLLRQAVSSRVTVQPLLDPFPLTLEPVLADLDEEALASLHSVGFTLELFGPRTYMVRTIPAVLATGDWHSALDAAVHQIEGAPIDEEKALPPEDDSVSPWLYALVVTMACHGAVRAGKQLSPAEMRTLVEQLEATENPRTCPHGRPTIIHMSQTDLERVFSRR